MNIKTRYARVISYFQKNMPVAETELHYEDPFGLVVSVILSAQCTDKRVNMITPALLEKYPTAGDMAKATPDDIFRYIKSCSYPNNKARHLSAMARKITAEFNGRVPESVDELMTLPGVGRKTANVITLVAFGNPAMPVDTHVFRVAARIGLTTGAKTPEATEKQLVAHFPRELLPLAHHWLILHGRYVCMARKPKCDICGLKECCQYFEKVESTP
ncbi:MAG: endonuclease III [Bacteroidales bacterium]|nr:endonuclease III [Bacteroidales bacterium]